MSGAKRPSAVSTVAKFDHARAANNTHMAPCDDVKRMPDAQACVSRKHRPLPNDGVEHAVTVQHLTDAACSTATLQPRRKSDNNANEQRQQTPYAPTSGNRRRLATSTSQRPCTLSRLCTCQNRSPTLRNTQRKKKQQQQQPQRSHKRAKHTTVVSVIFTSSRAGQLTARTSDQRN